MLTSLRIIARRLQGQSSAFGAIKKSSNKLFSTTKLMFDDNTNPALINDNDFDVDQPYVVSNDNTTNVAIEPSSAASSAEASVAPTAQYEPMGESTIVDINIDDMMYQDTEFYNNFSSARVTNAMSPIDGAPLAPIDIDPWTDEERALEGTTEAERVEIQREQFIYPPIPKDREGVYEFKGIKIELPKTMMRDSTYRYRLTPEERASLPDDTRILIFDPPGKELESDVKAEAERIEPGNKEVPKITE